MTGLGSSGRLARAVWYSGRVSSKISGEGWYWVRVFACACLVAAEAEGASGPNRVTWEVL